MIIVYTIKYVLYNFLLFIMKNKKKIINIQLIGVINFNPETIVFDN